LADKRTDSRSQDIQEGKIMTYERWTELLDRAVMREMAEPEDINKVGIDFETNTLVVAWDLNPSEWATRWDGEPIEVDEGLEPTKVVAVDLAKAEDDTSGIVAEVEPKTNKIKVVRVIR
jgi:hypothetical protein